MEISSVAHKLSGFGVGFSLCWFTGGLFLCLSPFLWGKVSDLSAGPLLSSCCDSLLIFLFFLQCRLTLDVAHWLRRWALWTTTCPISGSSLSPTHCQPFCLSSLCLLKVHMEISSLLLPPSLVYLQQPSHPLLCVSFQFLVYSVVYFVYFFLGGVEGQSDQGTMLIYPKGG
jgi:hypothetical protein